MKSMEEALEELVSRHGFTFNAIKEGIEPRFARKRVAVLRAFWAALCQSTIAPCSKEIMMIEALVDVVMVCVSTPMMDANHIDWLPGIVSVRRWEHWQT